MISGDSLGMNICIRRASLEHLKSLPSWPYRPSHRLIIPRKPSSRSDRLDRMPTRMAKTPANIMSANSTAKFNCVAFTGFPPMPQQIGPSLGWAQSGCMASREFLIAGFARRGPDPNRLLRAILPYSCVGPDVAKMCAARAGVTEND